jgi:hypothetical protein
MSQSQSQRSQPHAHTQRSHGNGNGNGGLYEDFFGVSAGMLDAGTAARIAQYHYCCGRDPDSVRADFANAAGTGTTVVDVVLYCNTGLKKKKHACEWVHH